MLPLSFYSTAAQSAVAGSVAAAHGRTSLQMGGNPSVVKPWDVKQEGGQMDSGWGTGKFLLT